MKKNRVAVDHHKTIPKNAQVKIFISLLSIVIASAVFLLLGIAVFDNKEIFFDSPTIHFIYSFRSPLLTQIMQGITFLGGDIFLGTAIVITCLYLWWKRKKDAVTFGIILLTGLGLNLLLKELYHRVRPDFLPLAYETSYSFPSGHAMNSFVFYTCLSFFVFLKLKNKKLRALLFSLSGILIVLIGISRIYLGVHYPSDVIAGYAAGFCWLMIAFFAVRRSKAFISMRIFNGS